MKRRSSAVKISLTALFTALMIAGTYIRIPLGPVPVVMTTLFIIGAGAILGPITGSGSVLFYLFLGALGLPVFSAGGGIALFMGPTGGFLAGYFLASITAGLIIHTGKPSAVKDFAGILGATLIIYFPGLPWLSRVLELEPLKSLQLGFLPFIPGDILKGAVNFILLRRLRKSAPEFFV